MKRVLITGGSGFIGTNLVEYYSSKPDFVVMNLDKSSPRNEEHIKFWRQVNLMDKEKLKAEIFSFNPSYVIHMAARTDLDESVNLDEYNANIQGVENIISILRECKSVQRVIFASSMLVCKVGYIYQRHIPIIVRPIYTEKVKCLQRR